MKKIISIITASIFFSGICFAQVPTSTIPTISPMEKGDRAPFSGVLFNNPALLAEELKLNNLKNKIKSLALDRKKEIDSLTTNFNLDMEELKLNHKADLKEKDGFIKNRDDHISFLEKQKDDGMPRLWVYALGVSSGVVLMLLSALAWKQVSK